MTTKHRIGAKDLGIDLQRADDAQLFRWLIACTLFSARINQQIAARAYRQLDEAGLLSPDRLAGAGHHRLVRLLDEAGYTRYDEGTADELTAVAAAVREDYDGRLSRLADDADGRAEVGRRLQRFKGIGPTGADIFLREAAAALGV